MSTWLGPSYLINADLDVAVGILYMWLTPTISGLQVKEVTSDDVGGLHPIS